MVGRRIYFVPGRGENQNESLGKAIGDTGYEVYGRSIVSSFERLRFSEQLKMIRSDIETDFWNHAAILIARSYGAYLLLHALADMSPFPGRILLFSPVLGKATSVQEKRLFISIPPQAEKLHDLAKAGRFPAPKYMEIHTGAEDRGCDPVLAKEFASTIPNTKLFIVAGTGHRLEEAYVRKALDSFLDMAAGKRG
jgi:hypothetical protein